MKMSLGRDNTPPSRLVMNSAMLRLTWGMPEESV